MTADRLYMTGQAEADALLSRDSNALLIAMVLDQQIQMEKAFLGPSVIADRMGGLDVRAIADADPEVFTEICARTPAIHRFPASMATRIQRVCRLLVDEYGGDAANLWADASSGEELLARIAGVPGFGDQKARMLLALLGKQYGVTPPGWRAAAGAYGEPGSRLSPADVVDAESLAQVRAGKKAAKAAARQQKAAAQRAG